MKNTLILLFSFFISTAAFSQSVKDQWEYLVIDVGSVQYDDLQLVDSTVDKNRRDKMKLFRYGLQTDKKWEAVDTEITMDQLGSAGWELVTVVGMIGGEQEMIFKRRLVPQTINAEQKIAAIAAAKIVKENDQIAEEERKSTEAENKANDEANKRLIEAQEKALTEERLKMEAEKRLEEEKRSQEVESFSKKVNERDSVFRSKIASLRIEKNYDIDKSLEAIKLVIWAAGYDEFKVTARPAPSRFVDVTIRGDFVRDADERAREIKVIAEKAKDLFSDQLRTRVLTIFWQNLNGILSEYNYGNVP